MVKICLIDDDQNILASLSLALKSEKFEVETYSDGIAGLEALKDNNFDMIDSIIVKSKEERDKINKITNIGFESYPNV